MPITFTYPPADTPIGPGYSLRAVSDFIGPLGSDPIWSLTIFAPGPSEKTLFSQQFHPGLDLKQLECVVGDLGVILQQPTQEHPQVLDGTTVTLEMLLSGPAGQVDSGRQSFKYDSQTKLMELLHTQTTSSGGLSAEQAVQLEETHSATFPAISIDSLLISEITNGPQGGHVGGFLPAFVFGVIIRIATVPPEFHVDTPDGDYWTRTLAVVRFYRGDDVWLRIPVHTSSKIISFSEELFVGAIAQGLLGDWLANISMQIWFAPGVTGQAFLMKTP